MKATLRDHRVYSRFCPITVKSCSNIAIISTRLTPLSLVILLHWQPSWIQRSARNRNTASDQKLPQPCSLASSVKHPESLSDWSAARPPGLVYWLECALYRRRPRGSSPSLGREARECFEAALCSLNAVSPRNFKRTKRGEYAMRFL